MMTGTLLFKIVIYKQRKDRRVKN